MALIDGARSLPTQHITVRVPWHDQRWNGTLCKDPCANTSCMVLPRVGTGRNDVFEQECAGQSLEDLAECNLPPCVDEHGTFMADFGLSKLKAHPYRNVDTHKHFAETPVRLDPFAAAAIPFRWMLKDNVEGTRRDMLSGLAKSLVLGYAPSMEPSMPESIPDTWIQEGTNQRIMLDTFFSAIEPQESLVFFYAKRTPLSDSPRRVIVGVGRVTGVGKPVEYHYTGGKRRENQMSGFLWERSLTHSIRIGDKDKLDGFLLPYHDLLALAEQNEHLELERCIAFAPDEAFEQYSYGSELLHHDNAIASLLAVEQALRETSRVMPGPWAEYQSWVDRELNRIWKLRGPFPGVGAALCAFGVERGNLLAWHLAAQAQEGNTQSVWDHFEAALKHPERLPRHLQNVVGPTLARKWEKLDSGRRALLMLLSRFELSTDQAQFWYSAEMRKAAGITGSDQALRENAYLLFEYSHEYALAFSIVDRGLFGARDLEGPNALPAESRLVEATDPRRVRALMVDLLEQAALEQGHTILPEPWMIERIRARAIEPACPVDADLLPLFDEDLPPFVALIEDESSRSYQLKRYEQTRLCIADEVEFRHERAGRTDEFDWAELVDAAIGKGLDNPAADKLEEEARREKAAALRMLYQRRISVLLGAAGTGKSTLIKALCSIPKVKEGGILLLAPTGKARVRLEQASGMPGQGQTIAQFLNRFDRYDGTLGRYFMNALARRATGYKTVVIDEASMLTEDQLAASIDALQGVDRLILVGDPKQLPPIGAGRPFVDICHWLQPENAASSEIRVVDGYAELLVTRRQQTGEDRDDLAFANLFKGEAQDAGADDAWAQRTTASSSRMDVVTWETTEQLASLLRDAMARELKFSSPDDSLTFEQSYGGSLYEDKVYFWPRPQKQSSGGAAEKVEAWQILTPLRHSVVGSDALNRQLQTHYRTFALELSARSGWRRIPGPMGPSRLLWGDKVINVQNRSGRTCYPKNPDAYVANGEIGVATGYFRRRDSKHFFEQLQVEMATQPGVEFHYKPAEFGADRTAPLELAYALTVHKTQGSEFGTTFIVIPRHCRLLTREMLYTALTRHRNKVVLLIQGKLSDLFPYSQDSASEIRRRMTNLFHTSTPVTVQVGNRTVTLDNKLIYRTDRDELVRSKSEWIIADKLNAAGIRYIYEHRMNLGGTERWPDFVIDDDRRGLTWYWEHLGLMNKPDYRARWEIKRKAYEAQGIVPIEEFVPGQSTGILITTEEDGQTRDLSEQIAARISLIRNPGLL